MPYMIDIFFLFDAKHTSQASWRQLCLIFSDYQIISFDGCTLLTPAVNTGISFADVLVWKMTDHTVTAYQHELNHVAR